MSGRKIGVYVCHCGGNISDYVDVDKVVAAVEADPDVVVARTAMFTCSDATQQEIIEDIAGAGPRRHRRRLVLAQAAHLHLPRRGQAGRAQPLPVHPGERPRAVLLDAHRRPRRAPPTRPSAWCAPASPAPGSPCRSSPSWSRRRPRRSSIGGGIAGLRAALGLAEIGLSVFLVEKEAQLGGWVAGFGEMYPHGKNGRELIAGLVEKVRAHPDITVFTNAEVIGKSGSFGNYQVTIAVNGERLETITVDAGSIVVATGFEPTSRRQASSATAWTASSPCPSSRSMVDESAGPLAVPRQAGQEHRLHLLRRQPPGEDVEGGHTTARATAARPPSTPRSRRPAKGDAGAAPVPPLPRHPHLRQVRAALRRVAREGLASTCASPTTSRRSCEKLAVRRPHGHHARPAHRRRGARPSRPTWSCWSPAWCRARTRN